MGKLSPQTNYRVSFSLTLIEFFGPPALVAYTTLRFVLPAMKWYITPVVHFVAILVYWTARVQYTASVKKTDAARRGARLCPEVKGRWPGNVDLMFTMLNNFHEGYAGDHIAAFCDQVGSDTVNLRILWKDQFLTRDHDVMQNMLATDFFSYGKGSWFKLHFYGLFGDGVFNSDGAEAKAHRGLTRPFFARERIRDFDLFDRYSDKVIDIFRARALANESVDVQDIFGRFTLDAAGEFLFGTSELNTLDLELPRPGHATLGPKGTELEGVYGGFQRAFEDLQYVTSVRSLRPPTLWPLWELITDLSKEPNREIDAWVGPLVAKALAEKKVRGSEKLGEEDGSLTDHLADTVEDTQLIRDELMNILLAARDTTASLLTFMIYMLSEHPDVAKKLRAEIIDAVPSGAPSYDDIRKLRYLRACLNETLRLFAPVPINYRESNQPTVLTARPGQLPIYMPGPKTVIVYSPILMQRRKDLWGPDADHFLPERWIDPERIKEMTADPFKFLPFNAGPRICLGQNFAYNESSFLMVRLMQTFDGFELRQKEDAPAGSLPPASWKEQGGRHAFEKVWPRPIVTLYAKGGMWIIPKVAKDGAH